MRILVTGGAGYVGSVLVPHLLSDGHDVTVLDNLMYGGEGLLGCLDQIKFIKYAVGSTGFVGDLESIDAIIHLAAIVGEDACRKDEDRVKFVNVRGTQIVVECVQNAHIPRLFFASTCSNYGIQEGIADETADLNPLGLYAETKVEAERIVLDAGYTVFRFATAFGLSPRMRFDTIVNEFALDVAMGKDLEVYNPDAHRPLVHVRDVARAISRMLKRSDLTHQIYNVGGYNYTKLQLAQCLTRHKPDLSLKLVYGKGGRDYQVSFDRIRREVGFVPIYTVEQGVADVFNMIKSGVFTDTTDKRWRNA